MSFNPGRLNRQYADPEQFPDLAIRHDGTEGKQARGNRN
jgi:hypothetical protein